jgi:hypothetical protein
LRNVGGDEIGADHALAGAGLLDLGNHGGLAGGDLGAHGADKVTRQHTAQRRPAWRSKGFALLGGGDFGAFDGDDLGSGCRTWF